MLSEGAGERMFLTPERALLGGYIFWKAATCKQWRNFDKHTSFSSMTTLKIQPYMFEPESNAEYDSEQQEKPPQQRLQLDTSVW